MGFAVYVSFQGVVCTSVHSVTISYVRTTSLNIKPAARDWSLSLINVSRC